MLSRVWLFATPWTVACQAPLSLGFSRQEYWSFCHFLFQGIFWTRVSCLAGGFFITEPPRKPDITYMWNLIHNTNLSMKQSQTHRHGEQTWGYRGGGMDWESGMDWVLHSRTLFIHPIYNSLRMLIPYSYLVLLSLGAYRWVSCPCFPGGQADYVVSACQWGVTRVSFCRTECFFDEVRISVLLFSCHDDPRSLGGVSQTNIWCHWTTTWSTVAQTVF